MTEETMQTSGGQEEDLSKYRTSEKFFLKWWKEISLVKDGKQQKVFERLGERIVKVYRNADALEERKSDLSVSKVMYNVLWSNVQVQKPLLYARLPKVVVERRFKDADPVGRLAAMCVERATSFMISAQEERFNFAIKSAVEDRLLAGRGQVWVRYEAAFEDVVDENGEVVLDEMGQAQKIVRPNSEMVFVDYVFWEDYYHSQSRNPFDDRWRAKRTYMTRSELIERFGDIGKKVELKSDKRTKLNEQEQELLSQAEVWEIEDKKAKLRIWLSDGYKEAVLDVKEDTLRLNDFFSSPCPLLATTTTDSSYPTPDYKIYERLAEEADYVTKRISSITDCIRLVGATAAQYNKDVKNMLDLRDGQLWPIDAWANFVERGGFAGVIDWMPFERCVEALQPLTAYLQNILDKIDLITGIPDFARGLTDYRETAEAQQRKSHWVAIKAQEKQQDVQRFCKEVISKMAEVIFEPGLFSDETIGLMIGLGQMPPEDQEMYYQALELLRNDRLRTFRVSVETDSTIAIDEEEVAGRWMQYIEAVTNLFSSVQNVAQFRPELMQPMIESIMAAVRSFRTGRPVEGAWERAIQQIEDNDEAAKQQPPEPNPEMMKVQVKQQEVALKEREQQFTEWFKPQELMAENQAQQIKAELESQKLQLQGMEVMSKNELEKMVHELDVFKEQFKQAISNQEIELLKFKTVIDEKEKLLTEERLQREEETDKVRALNEHIATISDSNGVGKSEAKASIPTIHIHNSGGSKEVAMRRSPNGDLIGKITDVGGGPVNE
jgi:hypothetical protein